MSTDITPLVTREAARLLDYFLRRTTSPEDAADLLSETLLVVWRRESAIPDDPERARMWMFGVARKVLLGQRRSSVRRRKLGERLAAELMTAAPSPDTEHALEVREAIRLLDGTDQEIIRLVYWDGFSLAEAAEHLGIRPATVRSRHARARARLRDVLAPAVSEA